MSGVRVAVVAWLGIAFGLLALAGEPGRPVVAVGDRAPDFFLRDREGAMHRLSDLAFPGSETAYRKKKKVLLDFFRTDCTPCKKELPEIVKYHQKHSSEAQVLLIALLEEESGREKLEAWLKANPVPFPVLIDAYEAAAKKYIVNGDTVTLPSIFLIDETGVVRARLVGLQDDLETELGKAQAAAPPAR